MPKLNMEKLVKYNAANSVKQHLEFMKTDEYKDLVKCKRDNNIIGSGTRYLGLDDLVQEVKSLTQAAEPAWAMLVNNASSAVDMLTISKTIESIAVEAQADPGCIDLSRINRKSPSPQHLVALLRTTYAFKDKITGWSELRDFAKAYVDEKGFVSARVMKGLDD